MLETAHEYRFQRKKPALQFGPQMVKDFIDSVPAKGSLFQESEKSHEALRAASFLNILENLDEILDHFDELSAEEQRSVLARPDAVIEEAHRWSHSSSTRDIQRELEERIRLAKAARRSKRPHLRIVREKYKA